ncbi:TPR-like protein [Cristinia sonorae]|uniref:TPR-like protein n=1 Tax=Cristinia sonorae TaxID=1940300 RepID=A0A8K0UK26_9AGAR|nr:TPR-like protein [Cristinia sonorae]
MTLDISPVEQALLIGKWSKNIQHTSLITSLAKDVVDGKIRDVLTSPSSRRVFSLHLDNGDLDKTFDSWFDFTLDTAADPAEQELLHLILAVACLHGFLQMNWTGPDLDITLLDILTVPDTLSTSITAEFLQQKAIAELAYGGEPAYHLAQLPILLRLAKILTDLPYNHCHSAAWWRLRTWLVHQQVLDEPVAAPSDVFTSVQSLLKGLSSHHDLAGRLVLEQGLLEHYLSHDKAAAELFVRAARETKMEYELTGALGKRTKFQQSDVTQLILLAESRLRQDEEPEESKAIGVADPSSEGADNLQDGILPQTLALNDDTLLEQTQFTSSSAGTNSKLSHIDPSAQPALHPLDQCILLSLCLNIKNTSPVNGLTAEQMKPYVARVISHPRNWSVHTMALLLRSRLEADRTRTVERATLQLQALVDQMPTADSSLTERLLYIHDIPLPSKWEMERELAKRFLSIGVTKSALEIFERLEMWEEVVTCWQSMEMRDKAVTIVRDLLEGKKAEAETIILRGKAVTANRRQTMDAAREAKLWCLLGDLEPDYALQHYQRAWEISKGTSGRSMRSLGGYYFARGDYKNAITSLRRAVAINPLLSRSWFILGCAYVRDEDWEGAREAFARCVSIDDEDGESWNNLASVYLRLGEAGTVIHDDEEQGQDAALSSETREETKEREIPFSNKMLAFRALKQGLKFSYENWRMWNNYMIVAMDVGELSEACRALGRVVEERSSKDGADCVDAEVLDRLVNAVTRASPKPDGQGENGATDSSADNPNEGHGLLKRVTDLFERVILPRVSSPRIFRSRAKLLTWQGLYEEAVNAYLEAYRCGVASSMEKGETDVKKWREGVEEVEETVDVLRNFGPKVEGYKWKLQARSIVRTFMARTKDFEDEPEWSRLTDLQEEVRRED